MHNQKSRKSEHYNEIADLLIRKTPNKIPFRIEDQYDADQDNFHKHDEILKINDDIPEEINRNGSNESIRSQLKFDEYQPFSIDPNNELQDIKMINESKKDEIIDYDNKNEFPDTLRDLEKAMDNPKFENILYENPKEKTPERINDSAKILKGAELPPQYGFMKSMAIDRSNRGENVKPKTKIMIGNKRKTHKMSSNNTADMITGPELNNFPRSASHHSDFEKLKENHVTQDYKQRSSLVDIILKRRSEKSIHNNDSQASVKPKMASFKAEKVPNTSSQSQLMKKPIKHITNNSPLNRVPIGITSSTPSIRKTRNQPALPFRSLKNQPKIKVNIDNF